MSNKLKATWWYEPNFGDALNPYLLGKLSGRRVEYCPQHRPFFKEEFKRFLSNPCTFDWQRMKWPETKEPVIMAIGSMLEHSKPNYLIWGTGFLRESGRFGGGKVLAVRGKFTAAKLVEQGFPNCEVYGDPALLMPLVYPAKNMGYNQNKTKLGIIPHYEDYKTIKRMYPDYEIIDMNTYDVESVINKILNCDCILSSSLHGVIVAHAYGIPALWIRGKGTGSETIKFKDYFSSVGIPFYGGSFDFDRLIKLFLEDIPDKFLELMLPQVSIMHIQKRLLEVAPFCTNISF